MGTRADFYIGNGPEAEWLGSIAWDGHDIDPMIWGATDEQSYRAAVAAFAATRDDWTAAEKGWPWPWKDSNTTDYAYSLIDGEVLYASLGASWYRQADKEDNPSGPPIDFPDMKARQSIATGTRSGLISVGTLPRS